MYVLAYLFLFFEVVELVEGYMHTKYQWIRLTQIYVNLSEYIVLSGT